MTNDQCDAIYSLFEAEMGVTDPDPEFEVRGILADGSVEHGMVQCPREATFLYREHGACDRARGGFCDEHAKWYESMNLYCNRCFEEPGGFHYIPMGRAA